MTTDNIKIAFARPQEDEAFEFSAVQRGTMFYLMLFEKATLEHVQQAEPVYVMACETAEQWTSAAKWLGERRDHWQRWAAMANISPELLAKHIDDLLAREPIDPVIDGYMVTVEMDGRTVVLREMFVGHRGRSGGREIWRRTFKSAAAGRRAQVWLNDHAKDLPALMANNRIDGECAIDAAIDARNAKFQQVSAS